MKSQIEKAFFLKQIHLFQELELELLLAIAEKLHEEDYDSNEKVFSHGQVANRIYFIAQGEVEITDKKGQVFCKLKSNDYFGDESLFNDHPRSYSAKCKINTILLSLSRSHLLSIISECPSVAVSLLQAYTQRMKCRFAEFLPERKEILCSGKGRQVLTDSSLNQDCAEPSIQPHGIS